MGERSGRPGATFLPGAIFCAGGRPVPDETNCFRFLAVRNDATLRSAGFARPSGAPECHIRLFVPSPRAPSDPGPALPSGPFAERMLREYQLELQAQLKSPDSKRRKSIFSDFELDAGFDRHEKGLAFCMYHQASKKPTFTLICDAEKACEIRNGVNPFSH